MPKTKPLIPAVAPPEVAKSDNLKSEPKTIELPPDLHRNRLIDAPTAAAMLGFSLAHFRRLYRAGKTPPPVRVNGRKVGWPASVLQDFVAPRQTTA